MVNTDPAVNTAAINDAEESYLYMKLSPALTGLPMAIWITPNEGYPHDVRIKVSLASGRGSWSDAVPVAVRPEPRDVTGSLPTADFRAVCRWLELNRAAVIAYW